MSQIKKYLWVIKTIHRAGRITLRELSEKWREEVDLSGGLDLQRQTFDRWKAGIVDMFGIVIDCEKGGRYAYFISNPDVLKRGELRAWLLNTYGTADALSGSMAVHDRILTEEVPSSQRFLTTVLDAMKANRVVKMTHRSFGKPETSTFNAEPYCVKMSAQRWYLLARNVEKDCLRLYALDRVESMELTTSKFALPSDFNAKTYFSDYFGIVIDDRVPVQRIVLRADEYHQHYMRTLPLHPSQKEIFSCEAYADFELHLRPTYDFYMRLMSFGNMVKVLEPQSLRDELCKWLRKTLEVYEG